jgi:hypothetical protein
MAPSRLIVWPISFIGPQTSELELCHGGAVISAVSVDGPFWCLPPVCAHTLPPCLTCVFLTWLSSYLVNAYQLCLSSDWCLTVQSPRDSSSSSSSPTAWQVIEQSKTGARRRLSQFDRVQNLSLDGSYFLSCIEHKAFYFAREYTEDIRALILHAAFKLPGTPDI